MSRVLAPCLLGLVLAAVAEASSLRFHGNGTGDIDRVKVAIDAPPRPADVGSGDFTIELWLRATAAENPAPAYGNGSDAWITGNIIVDRDVYGAGDLGDFGISLGGGSIGFGVNDGSQGATVSGARVIADGSWHHFAAVREAGRGVIAIYIDGLLAGSMPAPTGDLSYRDGRPTAYPADPFLVLGAEKHDAGPAYPSFSGWLDEIRISSVARYTASFIRPRAPFAADAATVALWHLDEGAGDVIGDSSAAPGGPSDGIRRFGGSPAGPEWSPETPFTSCASAPMSVLRVVRTSTTGALRFVWSDVPGATGYNFYRSPMAKPPQWTDPSAWTPPGVVNLVLSGDNGPSGQSYSVTALFDCASESPP